ncbi:MAG: DNA polymerase IV [Nitrospirota bacterium]
MRRILHMDMDAFFAAVEELRHPELRGKPVVIGGDGDPSKRGVVSTANYEARKYGIHSAMPLRTAYRLCPHVVFLPVHYREYARVSRIIKDILKERGSAMEDVGIDEAFLDISENPGSAEEIAREIKDSINRATGLTCSIGIAPNKLLAKLASDMRKPDGLTVIRPGEVGRVLDPLPVRKLWGVGPKSEGHLGKLGIRTVGEIRAAPLEFLVEHFGESYGRYLHRASRGIDESPLVTEWKRKSMSREETFERDILQWQGIARHLAALCREVAEDMREEGVKGCTVTVKVRFGNFKTQTRSLTLPEPVRGVEALRRAAFQCLGRFDLAGRPVRLLGVRVSRLEEA